ncbi:MAG: ribosome silencing factor [Planctomycetota bacterium]
MNTPTKERTSAGSEGPMRGLELARLCAGVLDEKKALEISVLHVEELIGITDYFVIASGRSGRHIRAAADEVLRRVREAGVKAVRRETHGRARWMLLDLGTVVVHVFEPEARRFYDLELLWGDAEKVDWR